MQAHSRVIISVLVATLVALALYGALLFISIQQTVNDVGGVKVDRPVEKR
jgi:hypothetical protein